MEYLKNALHLRKIAKSGGDIDNVLANMGGNDFDKHVIRRLTYAITESISSVKNGEYVAKWMSPAAIKIAANREAAYQKRRFL